MKQRNHPDQFGKDARNSSGVKSTCKACDREARKARYANKQGQETINITQAVRPDDGYNASSIRVLSKSEAYQRMPWLKADELASRYGKDVDFIERGLRACRQANVGEGYFIKRYLEDMKHIPRDDAVDYQSRLIQGLVRE